MTTISERAETATGGHDLPEGWHIVRFDQMAQSIADRVDDPSEAGVDYYVGLEHLDSNSLKIRRWGAPTDVEATKLRFRPGDIIFGRRRAYQRKVAVADFEGICSAHALVLRAREDVALPGFLPFFMQSETFFQRALSISVGSLSPTINWKTLAQQEFAIPPTDEQQRISEILWAAEEEGQSLQEVCRLSNSAYMSLLEQVFSASSSRTQSTVNLGVVCTVQVGYPFRSSEFSATGDRLLRCSNVGVGQCEWKPDETKHWSPSRRTEFAAYELAVGDIVIALDRPFISEGFKVARVATEDVPALLVQRVGRFMASAELDAEYLWAFLHSSAFKRHLRNSQQGTDLPHVSRFDIESASIYLPGLEEQRQWCKALRSFDSMHIAANVKALQSRQLYRRLLRYLLEVENDIS